MSSDLATLGIDLRPLQEGFKQHFYRGTGRYANELVRELNKQSSNLPFRIRGLEGQELQASGIQKRILSLVPFGKVTLETQLFLPQRLRGLGVDLLHFCSHTDVPSRSTVPYIVTVLDLIPRKFPELYRPAKFGWKYQLARALEERAIRNAHAFITISEASKRDIVELLNIPAERIFVTPLAVSEQFSALRANVSSFGNAERSFNGISLPEERPVMLYVGGIDARKNVFFLIDCMEALLKDWRTDQARPILVLAGAYEEDKDYPRLRLEIAKRGLDRDIALLGRVSDQQLISLYQESSMFLFPSLYEGFGLPVLEAMACGAPVVANNNSSIPEVAGDAAILVEENNLSAWISAITSLLRSKSLADELSMKGLEQVKKFSWAETAQKTLMVYQQVLSELGTLSLNHEAFVGHSHNECVGKRAY